MLSISLQGIKDVSRVRSNMIKLKRELPTTVLKIMNDFGNKTIRTSKEKYLSGRPGLNVLTGDLRASIRFRTEQSGSDTSLFVGSNVKYAKIHE